MYGMKPPLKPNKLLLCEHSTRSKSEYLDTAHDQILSATLLHWQMQITFWALQDDNKHGNSVSNIFMHPKRCKWKAYLVAIMQFSNVPPPSPPNHEERLATRKHKNKEREDCV